MARLLFEKTIRIHFGDTDPQGILFFARTFELAHECLEEYWAATPPGWGFWFQNEEFAVPLRHASADFRSPARAGELCSAQLHLIKVGNSSVDFKFELYNQTGALLAAVSTTHVFVDRRSFSKMSVPDLVHSQLQSAELGLK